MGKSGGRKKKAGANPTVVTQIPNGNIGVNLNSPIFLKKAHELKEEGNRRFQVKDFVGALDQYDSALKMIPQSHPDRAVFHSNKAACLMQMKPVDYDAVVAECSMALQVQPRFGRALLRRAKAYETMGNHLLALSDVQSLLGVDPNHSDALEIAGRLRTVLGPRQEAQQDLQSRPSPAALGASAVGAPVAGLGPCLPARPVPKKASAGFPPNYKPDNVQQPVVSAPEVKSQLPKLVLKPMPGSSKLNSTKDSQKEHISSAVPSQANGQALEAAAVQWRSLKLVYDHDIRLAQMPVNCNFRSLREIVTKRFPSSKSVLIKYKDNDGDLVTITSTGELRLAELCIDSLSPKIGEAEFVGVLRLHVVEVSPEQEPPIIEDEDKLLGSEGVKGDEGGSLSSISDTVVETVDVVEIDKMVKEAPKDKIGILQDSENKEADMDDWLFEFAHLFRTHVGIDPDAHIDMHELGMELCSEALEETVTSEDAQSLFDKAAAKFQEVAALAFFNWGNVHMCAARKRIPIDDSAAKDLVTTQLQAAYDWVREKYSLAREKYEEAISIKPDFYEGLLALGQQQFEMAKLHWSLVLARKEDLSNWDPTETIELFDNAQKKMETATEMWEKMEEERLKEVTDPSVNKLEELLKKRKKSGESSKLEGLEISTDESAAAAAEQAAMMRSQIHLFWGNLLFERSQIECRLGKDGWKKNLDDAIGRFKLAGASENDISTVLKNHCSNEAAASEVKVENKA
ncbi:protein CLMP1 [Impatiens glandulifera]|uniref:protein CLMP1 n=1 Tax=Impatiens glandulifera TaxID=253017 RepID=UPI001FB0C4AA|nr:protein CLMP1 [Impatiens glandulifera]